MVLLRENFIQLQYIGLWRPIDLPPNNWKSLAYWLYTIQIQAMMYCFVISQIVNLFVVTPANLEDFSDNCFTLLTAMASCVKSATFLLRRSNIIALLVTLGNSPHKPMDIDEKKMQEKFDQRIRLFTFIYAGFMETIAFAMIISVFFRGIDFDVLPYKGWIPYDYSKPTIFWCTYCYHLSIILIGMHLCISCDTTLPGFYIQVSSQFHLLKHRLRRTIDEFEAEVILKPERVISEYRDSYEERLIHCVQHHRSILEIAKQINSITSGIIFAQYSASTIVICLSIFMLVQMPLFSSQFTFCALYLMGILTQICLFCAAANEATVEAESLTFGIYDTKWYHLSNRAKSYLGLMMVRTLRPITFHSCHIIVLSLESFSNLLRHSYSAYTMLQSTM